MAGEQNAPTICQIKFEYVFQASIPLLGFVGVQSTRPPWQYVNQDLELCNFSQQHRQNTVLSQMRTLQESCFYGYSEKREAN